MQDQPHHPDTPTGGFNHARPGRHSRRDFLRVAGLGTVVTTCIPAFDARAGAKTTARPSVPTGAIPIRFTLKTPAYVTVVAEDVQGNRVRNLIAETRLPAGENTLYWDGYDDGARDQNGALTRRRVAPGTYRFRGLTHAGIRMIYRMTSDNPGMPPWATKDGEGGWLADHTAPADVLYIPGGVPAPNGEGRASFLVCSTSGEAGSEFVWLDHDGRRLYGTNEGFWGGTHLARDRGPNPAPGYVAYVFESGERDPDNNTLEVRGFSRTGKIESVCKLTFPMAWKKTILPQFHGPEEYGHNGLAVHNGLVVVAWTRLNKLVFIDARSRKQVGEAPLRSPFGIAFDAAGDLLAITGRGVRRFHVAPDGSGLSEESTVVATGLEDPRRLAVGPDDTIYVSDWGSSHQVKVFSPEGRILHTIGQPGGPQLGIYNERRFSHPVGTTADDDGRIWVAEAEIFPKRLSVWNIGGDLLHAWYGPTKYGGGGALDPQDPTRLYYAEYTGGGGIEFALDRQRGSYGVRSIYWRPEMTPQWERMPGPAPERAFVVAGRRYLVNSYNGDLRYNQDRGVGIWRLDDDHVARPVALIGNAADLVNTIWGWPMKNRGAIVKLWADQKPENVLFVWCDRNGDGVAQPDEIQWVAEDHSASPEAGIGGIGLQPLVHSDLSFTTAFGTRVPPPAIDARGIPIYDLKRRTKTGNPNELRSQLIAGNLALTNRDSDNSWLGFNLQDKKRWRYPSLPEDQIGGPGSMVQPTRLLGPPVTAKTGQAGPLVAINGEMGAIFLLTMDGLFIQTLGGDARVLPPLSKRHPTRGWIVQGISFQQEHFHPTLNQEADGSITLVAGFQSSTLLHLEGWEAVQRRDFGRLVIRPEDLAGIPAVSTQSPRKQGRPVAEIAIRPKGPAMDGRLAGWPADTNWLHIDARASAAVTVDAANLYVALRAGDPHALDNEGRDIRYLFKTGGALDLMLGTDPSASRTRQEPVAGDLRLTIARFGGRIVAALYRAIVPGTPETAKVLYQSPIGEVTFDSVQDVSGQVRLAQHGGDFEVAVPLRLLGLKPTPGTEILADVGVLRGSEGRTTQRVYWSNQNTTLVSDLPSEARLEPGQWGIWKFERP